MVSRRISQFELNAFALMTGESFASRHVDQSGRDLGVGAGLVARKPRNMEIPRIVQRVWKAVCS